MRWVVAGELGSPSAKQSKIEAEWNDSERFGHVESRIHVFLFLLRLVHGGCGRCVCWSAPYSSVNHRALMAFAVVVLVSALLATDFQCTERGAVFFQSCGFLLLVPCSGS